MGQQTSPNNSRGNLLESLNIIHLLCSIIGVVVGTISTVFVNFWLPFQEEINNLKNQVETLEDQLEDQNQKNTTITELENEIDSLSRNKIDLATQVETLENRISELTANVLFSGYKLYYSFNSNNQYVGIDLFIPEDFRPEIAEASQIIVVMSFEGYENTKICLIDNTESKSCEFLNQHDSLSSGLNSNEKEFEFLLSEFSGINPTTITRITFDSNRIQNRDRGFTIRSVTFK